MQQRQYKTETEKKKRKINFTIETITTKKVSIALVVISIVMSIVFMVRPIKIAETKTYEEQLEAKLAKGEELNNTEKQYICRYFLGTDLDKYSKYCVNSSVAEDRYIELFENSSKTEKEVIEMKYLIEEFKKSSHKEMDYRRINLSTETRKAVKNFSNFIKEKRIRLDIDSVWQIAYYSYCSVKKEITLNSFRREYKLKSNTLIVDSLSLIHIAVRHFYFPNYYKNKSNLDKYKVFDMLIADLETICTGLIFNKNLEPAFLVNMSKGDTKNIYLDINGTAFVLSFVNRDSSANNLYLKTFYIHSNELAAANDKFHTVRANNKLFKLTNKIAIYRND